MNGLRDFMLAGPARRRAVGRLLTLALVPVLLGVMACLELKVPVGNPERSRIDPAYSGMWAGHDDDELSLLLIEPWDKRTWLLTWMSLDCGDYSGFEDGIPAALPTAGCTVEDIWINKAWVTELGGEHFMTWEEKLLGDADTGQRPESWSVFHVEIENDEELVLRFINPQFGNLGKVETRRDAERILRRNARNPELYEIDGVTRDDAMLRWQRLPLLSYGDVRQVLEDSGFGPE